MSLRPAGSRDRRVTLRRYVEGRSASGAPTRTPKVVDEVWAQRVPARGEAGYQQPQDQRVGWSPVVWRILHVAVGLEEPNVKWDLVDRGRVYEVLSVNELGRRDGWELVTRVRAEDQKVAS